MAQNLALDLAACIGGDCRLETMVSFGQPMSAKGDFIAASLDRIALVSSPNARVTSGLSFGAFPMFRHDWLVTLSMAGWPIIKESGGSTTLPTLEQQNRAAAQLLSIGENMWRSLLGRCIRKTLLPADRGCTSVALSSIDRLESGNELFAGQAGWRAALSFVAPASASRVATAS